MYVDHRRLANVYRNAVLRPSRRRGRCVVVIVVEARSDDVFGEGRHDGQWSFFLRRDAFFLHWSFAFFRRHLSMNERIGEETGRRGKKGCG